MEGIKYKKLTGGATNHYTNEELFKYTKLKMLLLPITSQTGKH